ncbi:MAG: ATP-binding protein [Gemmatimonadales bacterium]
MTAAEAWDALAMRPFVRGLVHDLSNVVTALLANAELLGLQLQERGIPAPEELQALSSAAERVRGLVGRLDDVARGRTRPRQAVDLGRLVGELVGRTAPLVPGRVRLTNLVPESGPVIEADPVSVDQILANLVLNAIAAIDGPGLVEIGTRPATRADRTALPLPVEAMTLTVRDTGRGIPVEDRERIFEPYFTRRDGGTGLGLYLVSELTRQLGGAVIVHSEVGLGTVFRVVLPTGGSDAH